MFCLLSLLSGVCIPFWLILSDSVWPNSIPLIGLGRHPSFALTFEDMLTTRSVSNGALGVQEMLQRHPGVLLWDYSMEIPKDQRRERIWKILSTVKYFTNAVYLSSIGHLLSATHVIWTIPVCRVLSLSLLPSWPTLGGLIVLPLETMASGSSHCILPQTEHVSGQGRESEAAQRCQKMQHISTNGS